MVNFVEEWRLRTIVVGIQFYVGSSGIGDGYVVPLMLRRWSAFLRKRVPTTMRWMRMALKRRTSTTTQDFAVDIVFFVVFIVIVVIVIVIVVIVVVIIGVFLDVVVDFVGFSSLSRRLKLRQTSSLISFVTLNSDAFDRDCFSLNS